MREYLSWSAAQDTSRQKVIAQPKTDWTGLSRMSLRNFMGHFSTGYVGGTKTRCSVKLVRSHLRILGIIIFLNVPFVERMLSSHQMNYQIS